MAAKKAVRKKSEASLTKSESGIAAYREFFDVGLKRLSEVLSGELTAPVVANVIKDVRAYKTAAENMEKLAKAHIIKILKTKGSPVEDSKTGLALKAGDVELRMHRSRTGVDPKKLEAVLRTKGVSDPGIYMDVKVEYAFSEAKVRKALENGTLSTEELRACEYDESWTVASPKKVSA